MISVEKKIGVVRFLGTNCDMDVFRALEVVGQKPEWIWHTEEFEPLKYDGLVLPGGFSHGDYLRCGALAARSQVMKSVSAAAASGVPVLGICNGFQILCEAGLLPGVLLRNNGLRFRDGWVTLKGHGTAKCWGGGRDLMAKLPIAHGEGRYFVEEDQVKALFDDDQVWWTYEENPNGSIENIAGVMNAKRNVAGLMPHPERAIAKDIGGIDGVQFFTTF